MKQIYERRFEETKSNLIQMFKIEYAKVFDIFLGNKNKFEKLIISSKAYVEVLMQQELAFGGFENEFTMLRVPKMRYGENEKGVDDKKIEKSFLKRRLSEESIKSNKSNDMNKILSNKGAEVSEATKSQSP